MHFPEVLGNRRIREIEVVNDESTRVWYNIVEESAGSRSIHVVFVAVKK